MDAPKPYRTLSEVILIEEATKNARDRLMVRLPFYDGLRISETLGMGVDDIDFEQGTVTIKHLKCHLNLACPHCRARLAKRNSFCPKCGLKVDKVVTKEIEHQHRRVIPVDKVTLQLLKDFIKCGGPVKKNGRLLIFGINRHRAWQIIKDCAERAGLSMLINPETGRLHHNSPHSLRNAFAVNAVKHNDSGDGLRMLQEHLGHQSFNTTAKYRKVAGEELRRWYDDLWKENGGH